MKMGDREKEELSIAWMARASTVGNWQENKGGKGLLPIRKGTLAYTRKLQMKSQENSQAT